MRDLSRLRVSFLAGTLEHGGAERQLFYMLQALRRCGAAPRVLCLDKGQFWESAIRSLGVPLHWVGQSPSRLARLIQVLRALRADPADVLQSQHFFANAYVGLADRLLGLNGIGAMRNAGVYEMLKNGAIGHRLNLRLPRYIAANSRAAIRHASARGVSPSRLFFLPNVVDLSQFTPETRSARPSDVGKGPVTLLCTGRIVKAKRFDRFISALGRLRSEFKLPVRGLIVGPAQDLGLLHQLVSQAVELGLMPGHLEFRGGVSDVAPLYREADICVLTSDYEGTPNVLLEAMAMALPVVATNAGGVPDIVLHGESGFVVDRDDSDGLTAALAELVRHSTRRIEMGRYARAHIEASHSLERLPAYLEGLYNFALSPRRGRRPVVTEQAPATIEV